MQYETVILGAGAAGLMCAAEAGPSTLVLDHARAPGEKIRISGGGRCNFTNLHSAPDRFLSQNPHFHKSALSRYTQWDFIDLMQRHGIAYHEKTLGQLFCDGSSKEVVAMLRAEVMRAGAALWLQTSLKELRKTDGGFALRVEKEGVDISLHCHHLVVATGGKSIPKMGATGLAYDIADQFAIPCIETRPALVPLTFSDQRFKPITGLSASARVSTETTYFDEALLFTHRGLSGPAILQISSYWREGQSLTIDLLPDRALSAELSAERAHNGRRQLSTVLAQFLPARLVSHLASELSITGKLADQSDQKIAALEHALKNWQVIPNGSEGYRTAEVTLGGINTAALSSKTMMAKSVKGLYFIGEAVDVTGWLGGYNFQWAWSSGWAAAQTIKSAPA
ncbi:MAG: aminoacetone oxidase family FAD-binding enzyme [Marinovum sp.]|nr:aminoacetone oxidase family FAD-binding enzyme [Marinovum sp.]